MSDQENKTQDEVGAIPRSPATICSAPLTFGSLFAGIGGIDLGLERAGMVCKWQVELDEYCRKVLTKHWPNVPKYEDVKEVGGHNLERVDCIAGGFPCQDVSIAGKRAGLNGERSGLWSEYRRVICELRPSYALIENVTGLLVSGIERVLGDLAASGYDAEWQVLSAADFGAIHKRERVFIVAYSNSERCRNTSPRFPAFSVFTSEPSPIVRDGFYQSMLCRMDDGIPRFVDRVRALGNAVVPQVAEWIGQRIVESVGPNGGVDAAARFQSSIAGPVMMRNALPPLASNDLFDCVIQGKCSPSRSSES